MVSKFCSRSQGHPPGARRRCMISTSRANSAPADNLGSVVGTGIYRLTRAPPFPFLNWKNPGAPDVPYAGERHKKAQVGEFFRVLGESVDVLDSSPREYISAGDVVGA